MVVGILDSQWVPGFTMSKWMLNPQEGGRLDAKRHYVMLTKTLDGIWPLGHACAGRHASAQHCTGMANWPNTIQCLGSDDIMSLGIKSSAFLRVEETDARKFEVRICGF